MKCPKCAYLGFETGNRCKNCGYDFSLISVDAASLPGEGMDSGLPLFRPPTEGDDEPLIALPSSPRPPVAVRRTPVPRPRTAAKSVVQGHTKLEQFLKFAEEPISPVVEAPGTAWNGGGKNLPELAGGPAEEASPAGPRFVAALIDHVILLCVDGLVVYFTLRIAQLPLAEWQLLPPGPLVAFLAFVKLSYFLAFTAIGGQTIGKMTVGIRVVADDDGVMDTVVAARRTIAGALSLLAFGLGFVPALVGGERRAFHDRVAGTRVVSLRSA